MCELIPVALCLLTNLFPAEQRAAMSHQIAFDRTYQMQIDSGFSPSVLLSLVQVQLPCPVYKTNIT